MARHNSAIRQWRRSLRRNAVNRRTKSILRTQVKKLRDAVKNKDKDEAQKLLSVTFSVIDKSVKKGAIHKSRGSRYKSRLSRQVELINPTPAS